MLENGLRNWNKDINSQQPAGSLIKFHSPLCLTAPTDTPPLAPPTRSLPHPRQTPHLLSTSTHASGARPAVNFLIKTRALLGPSPTQASFSVHQPRGIHIKQSTAAMRRCLPTTREGPSRRWRRWASRCERSSKKRLKQQWRRATGGGQEEPAWQRCYRRIGPYKRRSWKHSASCWETG